MDINELKAKLRKNFTHFDERGVQVRRKDIEATTDRRATLRKEKDPKDKLAKLTAKAHQHISELDHPSNSEDFLEHMLNQTLKVDHLKQQAKKLGLFVGVIAAGFAVVAILTLVFTDFTHEATVENWRAQLSKMVQAPNHGPVVRASRPVNDMQLKFELMQNATDFFNNKTEYDAFIDQKSGQISLNKVSSALSAAVWGLVMAKARSTFGLSDLIHPNKI